MIGADAQKGKEGEADAADRQSVFTQCRCGAVCGIYYGDLIAGLLGRTPVQDKDEQAVCRHSFHSDIASDRRFGDMAPAERADTGQNPAGKNAHIDYRHHDGGPVRSLYLFPFQLHLSKKAYFFCVSPRCIGYMRCGHPALDILFVQ